MQVPVRRKERRGLRRPSQGEKHGVGLPSNRGYHQTGSQSQDTGRRCCEITLPLSNAPPAAVGDAEHQPCVARCHVLRGPQHGVRPEGQHAPRLQTTRTACNIGANQAAADQATANQATADAVSYKQSEGYSPFQRSVVFPCSQALRLWVRHSPAHRRGSPQSLRRSSTKRQRAMRRPGRGSAAFKLQINAPERRSLYLSLQPGTTSIETTPHLHIGVEPSKACGVAALHAHQPCTGQVGVRGCLQREGGDGGSAAKRRDCVHDAPHRQQAQACREEPGEGMRATSGSWEKRP